MPIKEPKRLSKRASKVRHRCINRNNKVEMFYHGRGVAKVDEVIGPIDYAFAYGAVTQLRNRVLAFLQAVEFARLDMKDGRKLIEANASVQISTIGVRRVFAGISRPD